MSTPAETPEQMLERLQAIAAERYYRVIYACSHYGGLYDTREEAKAFKAQLLAKRETEGERRVSCYVTETDGWDEAISEEGDQGREYCRELTP